MKGTNLKQRRKIILTIVFLSFCYILKSQNLQLINDTLNKVDSLGRKNGYWIEYLSKDFRIVNKAEQAAFYWYVRYSNGVRFEMPILFEDFKRITVTRNGDTVSPKQSLILLDGEYKFFKNNKNILNCIFKQGQLQTLTEYSRDGYRTILIYSESKLSYETKSYTKSGELENDYYSNLNNGRWKTEGKK